VAHPGVIDVGARVGILRCQLRIGEKERVFAVTLASRKADSSGEVPTTAERYSPFFATGAQTGGLVLVNVSTPLISSELSESALVKKSRPSFDRYRD